jgi:hypothetical protein
MVAKFSSTMSSGAILTCSRSSMNAISLNSPSESTSPDSMIGKSGAGGAAGRVAAT